MITDSKLIEKQIRRMGGLDDFPRFGPEAVAELEIVAARFGRSEAHLVGVMDEIMAVWTKCPKPSELRALLDRDREEKVIPGCMFCGGSGWKVIEKDGQSGASRCHCGSVPRHPGDTKPKQAETRRPWHPSDLRRVSEEDFDLN